MIPQSHIQDALSRAHIRAIAGKAGVNVQGFELDYKTDGTFRLVKRLPNGDYATHGLGLDFQLKSCVSCIWEEDVVKYDMKVAAYNALVQRNNEDVAPCVLLLVCLSQNEAEWLSASEDQLLLKKCCYWEYLNGASSNKKSSVRVKIRRNQLLTPESLHELLSKVQSGDFANG